eukprot:1150130-Pelagomonas_calceolata.AAC.2
MAHVFKGISFAIGLNASQIHKVQWLIPSWASMDICIWSMDDQWLGALLELRFIIPEQENYGHSLLAKMVHG